MLTQTIYPVLPLLRFSQSQIRKDVASTGEKTPDSYRLPSALLGSCRNCSWWEYASSSGQDPYGRKNRLPEVNLIGLDAYYHLKSAGINTSSFNNLYRQTAVPHPINQIHVYNQDTCSRTRTGTVYIIAQTKEFCWSSNITPCSNNRWNKPHYIELTLHGIFTDVYHCKFLIKAVRPNPWSPASVREF